MVFHKDKSEADSAKNDTTNPECCNKKASTSSNVVDIDTLDEITEKVCKREIKKISEAFKLERERLKVVRQLKKEETDEKKTQRELDKITMENKKLEKNIKSKCQNKKNCKNKSSRTAKTKKRRRCGCNHKCKCNSDNSQTAKPPKKKKYKGCPNRKPPSKSDKCKANPDIIRMYEDEDSSIDTDSTDSENEATPEKEPNTEPATSQASAGFEFQFKTGFLSNDAEDLNAPISNVNSDSIPYEPRSTLGFKSRALAPPEQPKVDSNSPPLKVIRTWVPWAWFGVSNPRLQ